MKKDKITISLPLSIQVSKKKKFILNLNNFRNAHFRTLSKAKNDYSDIIRSIAPKINYTITRCEIEYVYHHGTARSYDVSNPCSILDKFACDGLTHIKYWKDDDHTTIVKVTYTDGELDRDNPRCDMIITVLKKKSKKNKKH